MIRFLNPLFTTETTYDTGDEVKSLINDGVGLSFVYVITLSENEADVFDIFNIMMFKQPVFRNRDYDIIGLAENEGAAYELVGNIISAYQRQYGTYSGIKSELRNRLDNQESDK